MVAPVAAAGAYYVVVNVLGAGAVRYYIKKTSKKAAQELASKLAAQGGSKLKVTGPYAGNSSRVVKMIKSAKNKAATEGSKVIKDAIQSSKTKIDKVKDKVKGFFKKKDKPTTTEKKEPTLNINKTKSKKKITSGDPKLNTKGKKGGAPKTQKPKKGDTMIQKGKKVIWTGTKWVGYSVAGAAALGAGQKILSTMKTEKKSDENKFVKFIHKGKVYKNYADYKKAVEADKNKKVTKAPDGKVKITQKDRVVKKDDVKTVNNKKSTDTNAASNKTSGATTSSSSGSSGTSKSWKDYATISAAQRAGSPFFNRDGVKKAAVTAEQLTKSGLTLKRYMNIKLGKTARKK